MIRMKSRVTTDRAGSPRRRVLAGVLTVALLVAVAATVAACGQEEETAATDGLAGQGQGQAAKGQGEGEGYGQGGGQGVGTSGTGRIATALMQLVETDVLTEQQMALTESAIEGDIECTDGQGMGGGGRDWTERLAQIQTALDGLVEDGELSQELADAVMEAIEEQVAERSSQGEGSPHDGCTATPDSSMSL